MIRGVAFVPGSPLLLPGLGGAADTLAALRATCRRAVTALGPGPLVVLGATPTRPARGADPTAGPDGGWGPASPRSPHPACTAPESSSGSAPLAVGAELVRGFPATLLTVSAGGPSPRVSDNDALVVIGDGSACRGPRAPLPHDERAEGFDDELAAALASGDAARLLALDPHLVAALGAEVVAWQTAARLARGRRWTAAVTAHTAPLGVCYFVATWT